MPFCVPGDTRHRFKYTTHGWHIPLVRRGWRFVFGFMWADRCAYKLCVGIRPKPRWGYAINLHRLFLWCDVRAPWEH